MDHKTFQAYTTKVDHETGIVEAIVAVMGNCDMGDDVIHPGAFTKTITERTGKIRVLDQHRTDSVMRVVGKPLALRELSRAELPMELLERYPDATGGLWTKTQYLLNTPEGDGVFKRIAAHAVDEYSIGYDPLDFDFGNTAGRGGKRRSVRNLRTLKLYEYGPALWGMNPATQTLDVKGAIGAVGLPLAGRSVAWDASAAEKRVRTWAGAEDAPNTKYRQAFLWYDSDNADNFTSYKLQFADIVDDHLVAVPRALFAVAAVLQGGRGGVDIPEGDIAAIKGKVSSYYNKMRTEFEDDGLVPPWDKEGKAGDTPSETKPYGIVHEGDKWNVYKLDADGKPVGKPLGSHDSESEARSQQEALYANEGKSVSLSGMVRNVTAAFGEQHSGMLCSVSEVFDDHIIVCEYEEGGGSEYYSVPYMIEGDNVIFAPMPQWIEGEMVFRPSGESEGEMAMKENEEKAGRVFAARNEKRLRAILELVNEALAELETENADTGEETTPKAEGSKQMNSNVIQLIDLELEELSLL